MMLVRHNRIDVPEHLPMLRLRPLSLATSQKRVVGICIRHGDHGHMLDWLEARMAVAAWRACRALRRDMDRVLP